MDERDRERERERERKSEREVGNMFALLSAVVGVRFLVMTPLVFA